MKAFGEGSPTLFFFSKACRSAAGGEGLKHFLSCLEKFCKNLWFLLYFSRGRRRGTQSRSNCKTCGFCDPLLGGGEAERDSGTG